MIFINGALKNASNPLNKKISDIYGDECLYGELNDIIFKNIWTKKDVASFRMFLKNKRDLLKYN